MRTSCWRRSGAAACRFDGWSEHFRFDVWQEAFAACGLDMGFYANRVRNRDERLPWAFIDAGVTQRYLWLEHERAMRGQTTPDCRGGCRGCGLEEVCRGCE